MEVIKEWLVNGVDEPETFVDIKWQVIDEKKKDGKLYAFRVTHEQYPINLLILDMEETTKSKAIRLVIETGVKTIDLDKDTKLSLYRLLLDASRIPFVAFYIFGPEDEIGIAVDIDKRNLSKEDLEEHMKSLLLAFGFLTSIEALTEQLLAESYSVLLRLVATWLKQGITKEAAKERLVKSGLDESLAEKIVDSLYQWSERGKKEGVDSTIYM